MTNIATGLETLTVPIGQPELHPENYRRGDVSGIAESLTRFGQVRPIVVQQSSGYVVAGNHTLRAARELGWEAIAAVAIEMPDEEAEAYLVADNRLSDKATNDEAVLAPILERLMLAGRLTGTGWSPDDVDDMMSALDALPEVEPEQTEAAHAADTDQLQERFANRSQVALRQFVLMYDQDTATEVEGMFRRLERAWGVSGARDVVLEALRRASAEPPVEGLTVEEAERANVTPDPEPAVAADGRGASPDEDEPAEPEPRPSASSREAQATALREDGEAKLTAAGWTQTEDGLWTADGVETPMRLSSALVVLAGMNTTAGAVGGTGVELPVPVEPEATTDRSHADLSTPSDQPRNTAEQVERIGEVLGGGEEGQLVQTPMPTGLDPA